MEAAEDVRGGCPDLQLLHAGGPNDGGGDLPLALAPGQRKLCGRQAVLLRHGSILGHCLLRQGLCVALHVACSGTGDHPRAVLANLESACAQSLLRVRCPQQQARHRMSTDMMQQPDRTPSLFAASVPCSLWRSAL